jgi:adenosylcobinamide-GDP ribazoletransferase
MDIFLGLKFAFSYFTVLPITFKSSDKLDKKEVLNYMLLFLPLVGVVIGSIGLIPYYLFPNTLFAIVSALLLLFLTGFLHLEAVIDVVDSIYAKLSGKDAYKVIKEHTVGAIGVLWGVSYLILKVAGVSFLLMHGKFIELIMIVTFSRVGLLFLIYFGEFKSSFLEKLKGSLSRYVLLFWGVLFIKYIYLLAIPFLVSFMVEKRLGFKNGDVLGFVLESVEIVLVLGVASGLS